jgi:[acyl-carrier-protein] S-malonyltransferase
MQPAAERLEQALADIEIKPPAIGVITNVEARPNRSAERVKQLLVRQVTHRVRWEASVQRLFADGVARAYEIGHGNVLAGLVKRITNEVKVTSIGTPDAIAALLAELRSEI